MPATIIGHSISDADGIILAIDTPVAAFLRRSESDLIGRPYLSITHVDDRGGNAAQIDALRANIGSISVCKRYIGSDGSVIPAEIQVSRLSVGREAGNLIGAFSIGPNEPGPRSPQALWQRARALLAMMQARDQSFGSDLFGDHAWAILLTAYIAEAESRIADGRSLADQVGISKPLFMRWVRALQAKGLLERLDLDVLQLTPTGLTRVERLLGESGI